MKKIISISAGLAIVLFLMNACKKRIINGDRSELVQGSYITLTNTINTNLDFSNPDAKVAISIGSVGAKVSSVNIFLATGANNLDTSHWVLIKNVPYTDGVELDVTTSEIATALAPDLIAPGNQYVFQNEIILEGGRKFSVTNTPGNFVSQPGYNMAFTWTATAVCAFDQAASLGTYKVVTDDWADFNADDPITVSAGPEANQLSVVAYPSPTYGTNRKPFIIDVDPPTGTATISTQIIGDYPGAPETTIRGGGFIFSCTGTISLVVTINAAGTDYGNQRFILQLP